ncbi:YkvA family protein [Kribbella sp. NBC_00709]|uniref:YkvA family protein n=1 Tax=Kribbella sp. NBC_00709 TaxID=2975972 RepID=UPI002E294670|nr:YkvA family protein [Kribbella sp. NBC_00709]
MVYFGGFLGLIGLLTLIFRDGDVAGMPAVAVGGGLLVLGVAVGAFGVVRRRRVRRRKIAAGEPVPVGDVFQRARALPRLLRDVRQGTYADLPKNRPFIWVLALVYLISPIDILPDLLPVIGVTDDAGVAVWLLTSVSTATGLYLNRERERQRQGIPRGRDLGGGGASR